MRLNRLLAATLAAFFVGGCSTRPEPDKSSAPTSGAIVEPQEKPSVKPSHAETSAPPPQANPSPAETASLPAKNQDHPEDKDKDKTSAPPEPPDPYAGISAEWRPYYEQFENLLVPYVKAGVRAAFEPKLHEHEQKAWAVVKLGQYQIPLNRKEDRKAETALRALLANATDAETKAEAYLTAVQPLLNAATENRLLAAAYEQEIDAGVGFPAETRQKLVEFLRSNTVWFQQGAIAKETEVLRTKLLEQSISGNDLFGLALSINSLGDAVIKKRQLCRTFHDLLVALHEPHRTDILMQLAWSPDQEKALDEERARLKQVTPSREPYPPEDMTQRKRVQYEREYAKELAEIAAVQRAKFRAIEEARRDTIEGRFRNVDAPGWNALRDLNSLVDELQRVLDYILPDLGYRLPPLIKPDAPHDDASNILAKIPIPGAVEDRIPTIRSNDEQIIFDAPVGHPSYAEVLKPGNVLVGAFRREDRRTTYRTELHIRANKTMERRSPIFENNEKIAQIEDKVVKGELVLETPDGKQQSFPFKGAVSSKGFVFEVPLLLSDNNSTESRDKDTFTGSLDKGGPLTGEVTHVGWPRGPFSFSLKK